MRPFRIVAVIALLVGGGEASAEVRLLLDGNLKAGYQGGAIVRTAAGAAVDVEIYATGVAGAQGLSAKLTYDAARLTFESFTAANLVPGATGLATTPSGGSVEVGVASVKGAATESEGRLGVVRFRLAGAPDGAQVTAASGLASLDGPPVATTGSTAVTFVADVPGGIALDTDTAAGFQGSTVLTGARAGSVVEVEIYGTGLEGKSGYSAGLTYDASMLRYEGFTAGTLIEGFTGLELKASGTVTVGGASVSGTASASEGSLGKVRFTVLSGFKGEATVTLDLASVAGAGGESKLTPQSSVSVTGTYTAKVGDFDGNGSVDFADFVAFAGRFGATAGSAGYDARFDLDSSNAIDFGDFVKFAGSFGK